MKHNQKKTAFLFLWLFICMLVCLGTGLLAVSRSEASFYKRAAVMAACAPEKAGGNDAFPETGAAGESGKR